MCVLLGNCVTAAGQGARVSWVLLSKERGGEECPVTNWCEISGLMCVALVSVGENMKRVQLGSLEVTRRVTSSPGVFLRGCGGSRV